MEDVWQHIAQDNPTAARIQIKTILEHVDLLRSFPDMGLERTRLAPELRSIVEHPYVVFCYSRGDRIEIVRVIHGRQDIEQEMITVISQDFNQ